MIRCLNITFSTMKIIDCHTHHQREHSIINFTHSKIDFKPSFAYSVGLHPWWIDNASDGLISSLFNNIESNRNVMAIGECGIDRLIPTSLELQKSVFSSHIELSEYLQLPLIIHCTRAWQEIITMHRRCSAKQPWIIHGFRGKPSILHSFISEGFYISYGEHYNEQSLLLTPKNLLLIETDESALSIHDIATKVALTLGISADDLLATIIANTSGIFGK